MLSAVCQSSLTKRRKTMRLRHRHSTWILPLLLLALLVVILSCAPVQAGPRAWIDWPREGFETSVGTTVTLIGHAYAEEGVAEVRLEVNKQAYRVVTPDQAGEQFVEASADWFAEEPGTYLLSLIAFDANGQASNPASVTVSVIGEAPEATSTPEPEETPPPATPTPREPAATTVPTQTPRAATATPPPPTATPLPPRIVSFEVDRSQITAGQCVEFAWRVEGSPTAIYFDGEGVTSPASRSVCPPSTKHFKLRAVGPGGEDTESLTVVVVQPSPTAQDTQGPLIQNETGPQQVWAPDGSACRDDEPYQFQANVSDPSGVLWVKLIYSINQGPDQSGGMQLVSGTTYRLQYTLPNLNGDGGTFRWHIRACDEVNPMNCSDSGSHSISILDCPA
jgi:hypothetical protein